jgi:hypothetical protein
LTIEIVLFFGFARIIIYHAEINSFGMIADLVIGSMECGYFVPTRRITWRNLVPVIERWQ